MIAALLITTANAPVRVLELVEPGQLVVVQAYLKAPENMTEREAASWQVLGRVLLLGTVEYTPEVLRNYGGQAGVPPSVTVMPDFMRVQIVLPRSGLSLAGDLMFSVLTRPALREDDVALMKAELQSADQSAWISAMAGLDYRYDRIREGDVKNIWIRALRPENLNFVVGGGFDPGAGKAELESRFERWTAPRDPGPPRVDGPAKPKLSFPEPVSTFMLTGRTMTPASAASAAKLLSVFALGVGKEASMHRVLRGSLGLSYLQSAVLWPTNKGWTPSLLMVRKTESEEAKHASEMKAALLADVDKWKDHDLVRAKAIAEAAFARNLSSSPVWLGPDGPMTQSLFDRCAWRGYLEMVGSGALREQVMVGAMQNVDLEQLQAAAKELLEECNVGWVPGR
jgi:predicted Zn-dependent peptidase